MRHAGRFVLLAGLAAMLACGSLLESDRCSDQPENSDRFRGTDEIRAELARCSIPGFAGTMRLPDRTRIVFLTPEGSLESVRAYEDEEGRRPYSSVDSVVRVRYDLAELYDWMMLLVRSPVQDSLTSWGISETSNRIEVGTFRGEIEWVEQVARDLGIPSDAIGVFDGGMTVRGQVTSVDTAYHQFTLRDAATGMGDFDLLIVSLRQSVPPPRPGQCVEMESAANMLQSSPPQIGFRYMRVVDCPASSSP